MDMARIAQDGTPRSLYEQPISHFVANFIGDSNIVPVEVESLEGKLASVRLGSLVLTLPHRGARKGTAGLSIRPQALRLSRESGDLTGQVAKAAYLGSHMEYWISLGGIDKELFVIAPDVTTPFAVGDPISVALVPGGLALVRQRD